MRQFFWLLVLINIGLLAYFNLDFIMPGKPQIKLVEMNPEKIKVLSQNEIDALPKKQISLPLINTPTLQSEPATACYEWGIFSDSNLTNAQKVLAKLALQATAKEQSSVQPKRFWVYRPPLKTATEALKKAAEFKALGVEDLFVVQEEKWKNAISFGIFEDEKLAVKLQQELEAKGVKNVEKTARSQGKTHYSLLLSNLTEENSAELKKLKPSFPAADLKQTSCN